MSGVLSALDRLVAFVHRIPLRLIDRFAAALILVPSGALLGIAAWLPPDPHGLGTHRGLGLGPCTILELTGWPCPTCGMTTTFALAMHAHPVQAILNQPFGFLLFSLTFLAALGSLLELFYPRGLWRRVWHMVEDHEGMVAALLMGGMILGWIYKLTILKYIF